MKEKRSERELIEALLHLSEMIFNNTRLEIANVLHQLGYCDELISDNRCPICNTEKNKPEEESEEEE